MSKANKSAICIYISFDPKMPALGTYLRFILHTYVSHEENPLYNDLEKASERFRYPSRKSSD